jgi:hypothetical protein
MQMTITYNIPDDLEKYMKALKDIQGNEILSTDRVDLTFTIEELDQIDSLLEAAVDMCEDHIEYWIEKNQSELTTILSNKRNVYLELSNYINFMRNKNTAAK